jgi:hypothetical protein
MSRNDRASHNFPWRNLFIVLAVWAAIYLPGLGSLEIKGEEGRRILPAVTMLQSGNFLVPQVGSDPYFSKPPLINWLVAAAFTITGRENEWSARLPSVLAVLAVALAFITIARRTLGASASFIAALVWMTNFGMIEKGRLIELEALYISLTGLAFICWLSWWREGRSPWLTWTIPWIFLGLSQLAKGPVNLLFFYAVVLAVLSQSRALQPERGVSPAAAPTPQARSAFVPLVQPAHLLGVLIMLSIFAAWAIPCLAIMHEGAVAHTWARQFSGRLTGEDFKFQGWILNIPRGFAYFLPWSLCFFLCRKLDFQDKKRGAVARGIAWGAGLSFLVVSLLPGSLSRYTMPVIVPVVWLVALLLTDLLGPHFRWLRLPWPSRLRMELRLPVLIAALVSVAVLFYGFGLIPFLKKRDKVRGIAAEINAVLPAREPLYAVDPDYQPFLFYVREPIVYLSRPENVPANARFVLVQPANEELLKSSTGGQAHVILRVKDYRKKEVAIFALDGR